MNSVSPLIPQGSQQEQQYKARASLKTKIFCALGVNVAVLLGLLLMPGCKRETPPPVENLDDYSTSGIYHESNPPMSEMETNWQPELLGTNSLESVGTPVPATPVPAPETAPTLPTPLVPSPAAGVSEYVVQKGDTFSAIAPKFHVTIKALQEANPNVEPTKLQINQKLVIPAPSAVPPSAPSVSPAASADGMTIHEVKSGDNLTTLAKKYHTTIKAIQAANGLTHSNIKVGQKLKIPAGSSQ